MENKAPETTIYTVAEVILKVVYRDAKIKAESATKEFQAEDTQA